MTLTYIIGATLLVSLVAFVGLIVIFSNIKLNNRLIKLLISLAAGALLAVTFLDLLPEAIESTADTHKILAVVLGSFLLFFVLEKYLHWHHCRCEDHASKDEHAKQNIVINNLVGDGVHNFVDGALIATAFMLDIQLGVVTTIAVLLHELPQEISDFGVLLYAGLTKKKALLFNFIFALAALLGGISFYFIGQKFVEFIPFLAAFAAGNFLYLAAADLIPELHHEKKSRNILEQTAMLFIGVLFVLGISVLVPYSHAAEESYEEHKEQRYETEIHPSDMLLIEQYDQHDY